MRRKKLELTWIGKDDYPRLEPRILLEDSSLSYHTQQRRTENDLFDNRLVFGDNLLALKALEQEFAGRFKCIYIDPPFNSGQAFEHYDDGIEHSLWLSMMRDRLVVLEKLLADDGTIWVHLDDNEVCYLRIVMDEIFGRNNFVATVCWRAADSSNNDATQFSVDHNYILVYSKNPGWKSYSLPRTEEANAHYSNPDNDPKGPWFQGNLSSPNPRPNLRFEVESPTGHSISPPANGWRWSKERMQEMIDSGEIVFSADGKKLMRKTYLANQKGLAPSTLWDDIEETGHNRQAKYELKKLFPEVTTAELFKTPKPERLMHRILQVATQPGDWVLDSFAGSGTTGAVAHKMGRKWVMVELGDHCHTVIIPRLKKVIDGTDQGGVTALAEWKGGGGFRYSKLAPSLMERDQWNNWVISAAYNPAMLSEAMCKLMGFTYAPDGKHFWKHGYSSERDYIYVTTAQLTHAQLRALSAEVGDKQTLLVGCKSFKAATESFENLTVVKIPQAILDKCEWGRDDYSLRIRELEQSETEPAPAPVPSKRSRKKNGNSDQLSLLVGAAAEE